MSWLRDGCLPRHSAPGYLNQRVLFFRELLSAGCARGHQYHTQHQSAGTWSPCLLQTGRQADKQTSRQAAAIHHASRITHFLVALPSRHGQQYAMLRQAPLCRLAFLAFRQTSSRSRPSPICTQIIFAPKRASQMPVTASRTSQKSSTPSAVSRRSGPKRAAGRSSRFGRRMTK